MIYKYSNLVKLIFINFTNFLASQSKWVAETDRGTKNTSQNYNFKMPQKLHFQKLHFSKNYQILAKKSKKSRKFQRSPLITCTYTTLAPATSIGSHLNWAVVHVTHMGHWGTNIKNYLHIFIKLKFNSNQIIASSSLSNIAFCKRKFFHFWNHPF